MSASASYKRLLGGLFCRCSRARAINRFLLHRDVKSEMLSSNAVLALASFPNRHVSFLIGYSPLRLKVLNLLAPCFTVLLNTTWSLSLNNLHEQILVELYDISKFDQLSVDVNG